MEEQFLRLEKALNFMWRSRNQMHFEEGPHDDILTLNRQERIARALGYIASGGALEVELFMQDYYMHARELSRFYDEIRHLAGGSGSLREKPIAARGGKTERGLRIAHRQVYLPAKDENWFRQNPARLIEVIWYSQKHGFTLSEDALDRMKENLDLVDNQFRLDPVARNYFMAVLSDPSRVGASMRLMSDIGILDRYLPEFASIRDVVRFHPFHKHPVSEHTLRALENLAEIPHLGERGSDPIKGALSEIESPEILSLAVLLHDLGKSEEAAHAEAGARIAEGVCERLSIDQAQMEKVKFLIRNHTKMTRLGRYRDLDDPQIIRQFAREAGSVENLNMLYVLTCADLMAVRKAAWSDWISALLLQLYGQTRRELDQPGGQKREKVDRWDTPKAAAICEYLKKGNASIAKEHLMGLPPRYFAAFSAREIAEHIRMAASLHGPKPELRWAPAPEYSLTQITVCTKDRAGLFADIVGAFASQAVSVLKAAIFTRSDGIAIDSFHVVDGKTDGPLTSTKWAVVKGNLTRALSGERDLAKLIRRAESSPLAAKDTMPSLRRGVSFDNGVSATHTVIDIEAPDRIGLLYDIASALFDLGLDISVARIATDGRQARDAFYVADREGNKIEDPLRKREICTKLEDALASGSDAEAPAEHKTDNPAKGKGRAGKKRRVKA
jgi:[protein-PII] uridylyltransferase